MTSWSVIFRLDTRVIIGVHGTTPANRPLCNLDIPKGAFCPSGMMVLTKPFLLSGRLMTETPHPWDRLPAETPKAYAAFLAYCALGSRRSISKAAARYHREATDKKEICGKEATTFRTWMGWSSRHDWVSRSLAKDEWLASTSDQVLVENLAAFKVELTTKAREFVDGTRDAGDFLRTARAVALHFPPVQRVEDVTQIEDLSHLSDEQLQEMRDIRDKARKAKDKIRGAS